MSKRLLMLYAAVLLGACGDSVGLLSRGVAPMDVPMRAATTLASPCLGCIVDRVFERAIRAPVIETIVFAANPAWDYVVDIRAGASQGASALVTLNGDTIYDGTPVRRTVRLALNNTMVVVVMGKPGSTLVVTVQGPPPVASVTVAPSTASVAVGGTQQLTATLKDANGNTLIGRIVTWSSTEANVANVSDIGLVTAVAAGTVNITATAEGQFGTAVITVTDAGSVTCTGVPGLGYGFASDQFAAIPAGTFQMGSSSGYSWDEEPVHSVTISAFSIQKTEVTQGQWRDVMGTNPSRYSTCGANCPVEQVRLADIEAFLATLNARSPGATYRLPTEAEWEYAARAGSTDETYGPLDAIAWYWFSPGTQAPRAVSCKQPNGWGLYDMIGNVYEWVSDWYGPYSSAPATDPVGPETGTVRVLRGGSWGVWPGQARAAFRGTGWPSAWSSDVGFRLVRIP